MTPSLAAALLVLATTAAGPSAAHAVVYSGDA